MPPAAPAAAASLPAPRLAGFWVRVGAFFLDTLLFQAVVLAVPVVDAAMFDGELGTNRSTYEVAGREVVAETEEVLADGAVRTVVRVRETRIDRKGRSATYEIEESTLRRSGYNRTRTETRQLEADPGWGGRFGQHAAVVVQLAFLAYFAALWASPWRNTVGGRILKLRVTDYAGNRISRRRALGRALAGVLSLMTGIGVLMIALTRRKQALHDLIARTVVIDEHVRPPIPGVDPPGGAAKG